jgi:hypothetical protein
MQFFLTGFLADETAAQAVSRGVRRMPAVPVADRLCFVPVPRSIGHALRGPEPLIDGFRELHAGLLATAIAASADGRVVWFEASFAGGIGHQSAIGWQGGAVVFAASHGGNADRNAPPIAEWPVNRALRWLGVAATAGHDEWDTLRLGRHRKAEAWLDERIHRDRKPSPTPAEARNRAG